MDQGRTVGRRTVLVGAVGAVGAALAGCGSNAPNPTGQRPTPGATTPPTPRPTHPSTPSGQPLPAATPWTANPGELQPDVKRRATDLIQALAAWPAGQQGANAARGRVAALGLDPDLVSQAGPLLADASAREAVVGVIDAQYGGLLSSSASVLVVFHQWIRGADGAVRAGGSTVDVRLVQASPRWRVTELHPAQPGPPAASLAAPGPAVLASDRVHLPPAARADISSGAVHTSVLRALATLSERHVLDVSVVRSGHPIFVFGTDRRSDHPRGRAVDVWAIDGQRVVDPQTPHDLVDTFMRDAAALGAYNIGGPRQLAGRQFFSDDTHHDHVHLGFAE